MAGDNSFTIGKIKNLQELTGKFQRMLLFFGLADDRPEGFFVQIILAFQLEVPSQVEPAHLFIFGQFFRSSMFEDLSIDQQVGAVADAQAFRLRYGR